jgi:2-amino-4-hydroxy-6-hydroxymethyldihydropteridine diphosphokinase
MTAPEQMGFSLGSNLGDRIRHIRRAAAAILAMEDARLVAKSALYETEPVDVKPEFQHMKFVNSVLVIETAVPAEIWLKRIGDLEVEMGRERDRTDKNAPRNVDVDILFAGDRLIGSGGLIVPHPRWAERRFVVEPLAEVLPDRVLPGVDRSVAQVLADLPGEGELVRLDEEW